MFQRPFLCHSPSLFLSHAPSLFRCHSPSLPLRHAPRPVTEPKVMPVAEPEPRFCHSSMNNYVYASWPQLHFPGAGLYFRCVQWTTRPGSASCNLPCYIRTHASWDELYNIQIQDRLFTFKCSVDYDAWILDLIEIVSLFCFEFTPPSLHCFRSSFWLSYMCLFSLDRCSALSPKPHYVYCCFLFCYLNYCIFRYL